MEMVPSSERTNALRSVREEIKKLGPQEVAILYDGGQTVEKMDKFILCSLSKYFANALDGSFKEATTRVIRLRHDFPWAVYAMLDFLKKGTYYMYPRLQEQYPQFTMLDLHVHCYVLADKYDIPALANSAAFDYLRMAADILSLDWYGDDPDCYDTTQDVPFVDYHPHDMCAAAEVSRLLYSVVLLWRNTPNRHDPLRREVIEMIKSCFAKLMHLKSFHFLIYQLRDFLTDLAHSFTEDDMQVMLKVDMSKVGFSVIFAQV